MIEWMDSEKNKRYMVLLTVLSQLDVSVQRVALFYFLQFSLNLVYFVIKVWDLCYLMLVLQCITVNLVLSTGVSQCVLSFSGIAIGKIYAHVST